MYHDRKWFIVSDLNKSIKMIKFIKKARADEVKI